MDDPIALIIDARTLASLRGVSADVMVSAAAVDACLEAGIPVLDDAVSHHLSRLADGAAVLRTSLAVYAREALGDG